MTPYRETFPNHQNLLWSASMHTLIGVALAGLVLLSVLYGP